MRFICFLGSAVSLLFCSGARAQPETEVQITGGYASRIITRNSRVNRHENASLTEVSVEMKRQGSALFPYASCSTWGNEDPARSSRSHIFVFGVGLRSKVRPKPGDISLQGQLGAGLIVGRNTDRFARGPQMFQAKANILYQISERWSGRIGIAHYSNGDILLAPGKNDHGKDFITLGIGYRF